MVVLTNILAEWSLLWLKVFKRIKDNGLKG